MTEEQYWRDLPLHKLRALCVQERRWQMDGHYLADICRHRHMLRVYRERQVQEISAVGAAQRETVAFK